MIILTIIVVITTTTIINQHHDHHHHHHNHHHHDQDKGGVSIDREWSRVEARVWERDARGEDTGIFCTYAMRRMRMGMIVL